MNKKLTPKERERAVLEYAKKVGALRNERDILRIEFEKFIEIVDENLLLDEGLAQSWDILNKAVIAARKRLNKEVKK